ncbi:unnamed protein product [Brachionus calyciflorus]|uniref:Uncharacterized protein n=1 Tax=Brachionus calyciflorus TaxID=104777 RepID=A0A813XUR2_9BILA|nr:unnamed protein product [Brachionus calyciflorus]
MFYIILVLINILNLINSQEFETENGCLLQFKKEDDFILNRQLETINVYAGNGYVYDLACSVADPKMRSGDKYYVIDVVLYGPNSRVSKAWREQYTTSNLFKTRNLSLSKKVTLNSIGMNSIVCSVSKYNNQVNKFTKICQKKIEINATENTVKSTNQYLHSTKLNFFQLSDLQRLAQKKKKIYHVENNNKDIANETLYESLNRTSNLTARAMLYKSIYQAKIDDDKKVTATNDLLKQSPLSKNDQNDRKLSFLQPMFIIFIFLVIFSISIGTIIYLTYNQKEYTSVLVVGDHESDSTSCESNSRDEMINNSTTISQ